MAQALLHTVAQEGRTGVARDPAFDRAQAWAVSKNVTPTSSAVRTAASASSRSSVPQPPPNCQVPKQMRETFRPLLPSST
jgi:hypothetical protein